MQLKQTDKYTKWTEACIEFRRMCDVQANIDSVTNGMLKSTPVNIKSYIEIIGQNLQR